MDGESASRELRASAFTLVDEAGRARGGLEVADGEPRMALRDTEGRVRVFASLVGGNPQLLFADENGVVRIGIDCYAEGPSVFLRDRNGDVRIGVDFEDATDTALITLIDDERKTRVELREGGEPRSTALNLYGDDNTVRMSLLKDGADAASISLAESARRVNFLAAGGSIVLSRGDATRVIGPDDRETAT